MGNFQARSGVLIGGSPHRVQEKTANSQSVGRLRQGSMLPKVTCGIVALPEAAKISVAASSAPI
jgi:hypothetical protein